VRWPSKGRRATGGGGAARHWRRRGGDRGAPNCGATFFRHPAPRSRRIACTGGLSEPRRAELQRGSRVSSASLACVATKRPEPASRARRRSSRAAAVEWGSVLAQHGTVASYARTLQRDATRRPRRVALQRTFGESEPLVERSVRRRPTTAWLQGCTPCGIFAICDPTRVWRRSKGQKG